MIDVSIVIPTYNRTQSVGQAIESCLAQDGLALEVVLVDDASSRMPVSSTLRADARIRIIELEKREGPSNARNVGLKAARGQYVKFLDSDDVLVANTLSQEVMAARQTDADIVVSNWGTRTVDPEWKPIPGSDSIQDCPVFGNVIDDVLVGKSTIISAALYRMDLVSNLKWDTDLKKLQDWDWFCQCALRAKRIYRLPLITSWWQHHASPRVTKSGALLQAQSHHHVLRKIEHFLRQGGFLSAQRKQRLAQYYYKEIRTLARCNYQQAVRALDHIFSLDAHFKPVDEEPSRIIRLLTSLFGVRRTIHIYALVKRQ